MSKSGKDKQPGGQDGGKSQPKGGEDGIKVSGWSEGDPSPRWKEFPVPEAVGHFRVTFTRQSYADLVAHAKADLGAEVCGVLAGQFCEDEQGLYVSVESAVPAAPRGRAPRT